MKNLVDKKKSKVIQREVIESNDGNSGMMWKAVKRTLNWVEGGPPSALKDKKGNILTNAKEIAERFHEVLREKTKDITQRMEEYREDELTEEEELNRIGLHFNAPEFQFRNVSENDVKECLQELPRKSTT